MYAGNTQIVPCSTQTPPTSFCSRLSSPFTTAACPGCSVLVQGGKRFRNIGTKSAISGCQPPPPRNASIVNCPPIPPLGKSTSSPSPGNDVYGVRAVPHAGQVLRCGAGGFENGQQRSLGAAAGRVRGQGIDPADEVSEISVGSWSCMTMPLGWELAGSNRVILYNA